MSWYRSLTTTAADAVPTEPTISMTNAARITIQGLRMCTTVYLLCEKLLSSGCAEDNAIGVLKLLCVMYDDTTEHRVLFTTGMWLHTDTYMASCGCYQQK